MPQLVALRDRSSDPPGPDVPGPPPGAGPNTRPAEGPAGDGGAVVAPAGPADLPQDREAMARRRAERLARFRGSSVDAYPMVGRRDPRWDAAATAGLAAEAEAEATGFEDPDRVEAAWEALDRAVAVGCDDPLVRFLRHRFAERRAPPGTFPAPTYTDMAGAAEALRVSRYPAVRRARAAHFRWAMLAPSPRHAGQLDECLGSAEIREVRRLLVEAWRADPRGGPEAFVEVAAAVQAKCADAPGGRDRAFRAFAGTVDDLPGAAGVFAWLEGQYLQDRGWAARGFGWARDVPPAAARAFQEDLAAAGRAFEAAWAADPTRPEVAVGRLGVAVPVGTPAERERWLQAALRVDGDSTAACRLYGTSLLPKWGGRPAAVREFAARLVATGNWHARLPFVGVDLLIYLSPNEDALPAEDWPVAERVFEEYLAAHPDSRWGWSRLLALAGSCGRHDVVLRAADRLGGRPLPAVLSRAAYDKLVRAARAGGR